MKKATMFEAIAWGDRIRDEQLDELLARAERCQTVKLRIDQFRDLVLQAKGQRWRPMLEIPQAKERTEMLFRKEWTGRDDKVRATHEVLYLWPDGALTDYSETVVAPEEMPTHWMPLPAEAHG